MSEIELLKKLIAIASITPIDGGCMDLIKAKLQPLGFKGRNINSTDVSNLWIFHGDGAPTTCMLGHIDVVPTGPIENWQTPPFSPTEIDGYIHGRGACDMKGGVAAMVCAAYEYVKNNPQHQGTIGILITSDEEGPSIEGTTFALEKLNSEGQKFTYGIVGEPTCTDVFGDVIKNGRRGSLSGKLTIIGKQGHVAYPSKGINAVHIFAGALQEIVGINWDNGNDLFPPTTFQISNINAGTGAGNIIPGEMNVDFNFRYGTVSTVSSLQKRLTKVLDRHQLNYKISWDVGALPYLTTQNKLINIFKEVIKFELNINPRLETTGGTSDGRFLAKYCDEVLEFGTRNQTIHQVNEKVSIEEVKKLKIIYKNVLKKIYG